MFLGVFIPLGLNFFQEKPTALVTPLLTICVASVTGIIFNLFLKLWL